MGKTRDLFKNFRDTKGSLHSKMGKINNLRYADDTTLMAEGKEEL